MDFEGIIITHRAATNKNNVVVDNKDGEGTVSVHFANPEAAGKFMVKHGNLAAKLAHLQQKQHDLNLSIDVRLQALIGKDCEYEYTILESHVWEIKVAPNTKEEDKPAVSFFLVKTKYKSEKFIVCASQQTGAVCFLDMAMTPQVCLSPDANYPIIMARYIICKLP